MSRISVNLALTIILHIFVGSVARLAEQNKLAIGGASDETTVSRERQDETSAASQLANSMPPMPFEGHWSSVFALAIVALFGVLFFYMGLPKAEDGGAMLRGWNRQERVWLVASMTQVMLITGTISFTAIEFPGRAINSMGMEYWKIGVIFGALPLGHCVAMPWYPRLARRFWDSSICSVMAILRGCLLLAFAYERNFFILVLLRFGMGVTNGFAHTASLSFMNVNWPRKMELTAIMEHEDDALNLGAAIGYAVGAMLFMYGYSTPFWTAFVLNVVLAVIMFRTLRTPLQDGGKTLRAVTRSGAADCILRRKAQEEKEPDVCYYDPSLDAVHEGMGLRSHGGGPPAPPGYGPGNGGGSGGGSTTMYAAEPHQGSGSSGNVVNSSARHSGGIPNKGVTTLITSVKLAVATISVLMASGAMAFWEPLLAQHLRINFNETFASPLDVGTVWATLHVTQIAFGIGFGRFMRVVPSYIMWAMVIAGWTILPIAFELVACPHDGLLEGWKPGMEKEGSFFFSGLALFTCAIVMIWTPSMPCMLQVASPFGTAVVEQVVPEVWVGAYSLGEIAGPVFAAAVAGAIGIPGAAHVVAAVSAAYLVILVVGIAGSSTMVDTGKM